MRIITGTARGTRLLTPADDSTRPTTEMAKEGIFSALQFELIGAEVLDLFSGTGQLALEALSRGAQNAVMVDSARRATALISENVRRTKLSESASVLNADAFAYLKSAKKKFNIIFADPPYETGLAEKVAEKVLEHDALKAGGVLVVEAESEDAVPSHVREAFSAARLYRYGKTFVWFLRKGI